VTLVVLAAGAAVAVAGFAWTLCRAAADADRAPRPPATDPAWEDLRRQLEEPARHCPMCGTWLAGDDLFDTAECQWLWMEAT